ncbi:hypothetical protein, partial [Streptomyces sp. 8K308]|uniref:hypothetical protein n=1 Tax=Streptomyces sp. 8K308 TaxID=2530388 RepID=UPI001A9FFA03
RQHLIDGARLRPRHLPGPLFTSIQLVERVRRSFRSAFSEAAADGATGRRIVLLLVRRSPKGHLFTDDLAAMLTTTTSCPVGGETSNSR